MYIYSLSIRNMTVIYNPLFLVRMQNLQRLFGRELSNVQQTSQHVALPHPNKLQASSFSLHQQDPPSKADHPVQPNVSLQVQRPAFSRGGDIEVEDLSASLTDYFDEVMGTMLSKQSGEMLGSGCLWRQGAVTEGMRTVLFDWIVEIHLKFKMFPQTLFIVAAILDRYLSKTAVSKDQLQLVGASALFIAAKYEETYRVPEASQLVAISAKVFSKQDILKTEADILRVLDFELVFSTSYHFFQPFSALMRGDQKRVCLAHYLLELALMEAKFLRYRGSLLAAAAIYLVNKVKKIESPWPDCLVAASGYEERELRSCARELCQLLEGAQSNTQIKSLKRKFALPRFCQVSKIRLQKKRSQQE